MPPSPTPNLNSHANAVAMMPMDVDANRSQDEKQKVGFKEAESILRQSEKLEDDLKTIGIKIKQHEDNLYRLNTERSKLDDAILHLQEFSNMPKIDNGDNHLSIEEVNSQIMKHEKTAAGVWCQIKTRHETLVSQLPWSKDTVGIVAMLAQVEDANMSRVFSEYLGVENMLAIVCKTYEGVKALELYGNDGSINKSSGLHGLGASIGRVFDGRFRVICLDSLRPYPGKHEFDDLERKLEILSPRLPNGQLPAGFLGFAVNMLKIDIRHRFCVTPRGYGLRETLFYNLFARTQVYKTRADMLQALPCICDGALSLDGGIVRSYGDFYFGSSEVDVMFPRPGRLMSDKHLEMEKQMKDLKCKKDKVMEEFKKEQNLLDVERFTFETKKNEFIAFLAHSSSLATPVQTQTALDRQTPR